MHFSWEGEWYRLYGNEYNHQMGGGRGRGEGEGEGERKIGHTFKGEEHTTRERRTEKYHRGREFQARVSALVHTSTYKMLMPILYFY